MKLLSGLTDAASRRHCNLLPHLALGLEGIVVTHLAFLYGQKKMMHVDTFRKRESGFRVGSRLTLRG